MQYMRRAPNEGEAKRRKLVQTVADARNEKGLLIERQPKLRLLAVRIEREWIADSGSRVGRDYKSARLEVSICSRVSSYVKSYGSRLPPRQVVGCGKSRNGEFVCSACNSISHAWGFGEAIVGEECKYVKMGNIKI